MSPAHVDDLLAKAKARPGDPVLRAQLALAFEPGAGADEAFVQAMGLARTCLELGLNEPANACVTHLWTRWQHVPELVVLRADLLLQKEAGAHVDEARRLLEAVVAEHPDALEARIRVAALTLGLGEPEAARRWIEPVFGMTAETRALYVQTLLALGAVAEAADVARKGLDAGETGLMYQLLGVAELSRGRVDAAIHALSEGLRLAPDDPVAYYNLALAFEASGSRLAALGVCDAGLELAPEDVRLGALKARLALHA